MQEVAMLRCSAKVDSAHAERPAYRSSAAGYAVSPRPWAPQKRASMPKWARKFALLCLLVLISFAAAAEPLDFVVLLDISESMMPYFDDTVNYLIRDILKQHLAPSDGFHLLTFASTPAIELTLEIKNEQNVDDALNRVLLLQPLGKYTDLVSALKFVYTYTSGLRQDSHKKILVLTDGIHDPPPGSPYPVRDNIFLETAKEVAQDIRREGWDITLVQFPSGKSSLPASESGGNTAPGSAQGAESTSGAGVVVSPSAGGKSGGETGSSGQETQISPAAAGTIESTDKQATGAGQETVTGPGQSGGQGSQAEQRNVQEDLYPTLAKDLDVDVLSYDAGDADITHRALGAPELVFPDDLGKVGYSFILPLTIRNLTDEKILVELSGLIWNNTDILNSQVTAAVPPEKSAKMRARVNLPRSIEPGPLTLNLEAVFKDDLRIYPRKGAVSVTLRGSAFRNVRSANVLPVLGYIGLSLVGIIVLTLMVFGARALVTRVFATIGTSAVQGVFGTPSDRAIEMYVEGQNSKIGTRNVNYIRDGGSASVGGGFSSFLIYLYKLPARIGLVSRKGTSYTFTPEKPEFFESGEVKDCLDKDITVLCNRGRKVKIRFRRFISPLERINAIMRLAQKPEPKKDQT